MLQFAYTAEGWAAQTKNPIDRTTPFREMVKKHGGKLVSVDFCFGEFDAVILFEAPDDTAAAAIVLTTVSPGHIRATKTTRLIPVAEMLDALAKAGSVSYQGPPKG